MPLDPLEESEWLIGTFVLPDKVRDGDALITTAALICLELPRNVLLLLKTIDADNPGSLGQMLVEEMRDPDGLPRRPARIRVQNQAMADSVREATGGGIEIVVAPVPELEEIFDSLAEHLANQPQARYDPAESISPDLIGRLFSSAEVLYRVAPWRDVVEEQVVRVDIPDLGVRGACLSVIGSLGQSFGILLFRSPAEYVRLADPDQEPSDKSDGPRPDAAMRSLSFDPKKDIPPSSLKKIKKLRWPVAGPKAYPVIFAVDDDRLPLDLTERDVRIMSATASAFAAFLALHRHVFNASEPETTVDFFKGDDDVMVQITAPYEPDRVPRKRKPRKPRATK
jgi:hypothetical protein